MPSDTGLIALGLIMLAGQIILYEMYQRGWFKKEIFKMNKSFQVATNKLQFEKLRKDLGLTDNPYKAPPKNALDKLKDVDLKTVKSAVKTGLDLVQKKDDEEFIEVPDEELSPIDMVVEGVKDFANKNPEAVNNLLNVAKDKIADLSSKEKQEDHVSQSG